MKKRSLLVVAIILLLAMSVSVLVACGGSDPFKILEKAKTATYGTVTSEMTIDTTNYKSVVSFDGTSVSQTSYDKDGKIENSTFVTKVDSKFVLYTKEGDDAWENVTESETQEYIAENFGEYSFASFFKEEPLKSLSTDKTKYIENKGVYTSPTLYTLQAKKGILTIGSPSIANVPAIKITIDLSKPTLTVPTVK